MNEINHTNVIKSEIESILIKSFAGYSTQEEDEAIAQWLTRSEDNIQQWRHLKKIWDDSTRLQYSGEINLDKALRDTKKQIPHFKSQTLLFRYLTQAVAVLLLSLVFSGIINYFIERIEKPGAVVYQEIKAAYGTQTRLLLADGTQVWLNSGSILRFPTDFDNQSTRDVSLTGEGYFEVYKDASKPFVVHTQNLGIKVLGTSFNVNAYKNESHVVVALVEGKVSVQQQVKSGFKELLQLAPSEIADFDRNQNKIVYSKESQIDRYTAWKDGKVVFFDESMDKIVRRLENWYNVEIEIADNSLLKNHITATFDDESLDRIVKYLSMSTSFKYKYVDLTSSGGFEEPRQKIIFYR